MHPSSPSHVWTSKDHQEQSSPQPRGSCFFRFPLISHTESAAGCGTDTWDAQVRGSSSIESISCLVWFRVSEQIRGSTRVLARNLQDNPNLAENLNKVALERVQLQALLTACLKEISFERDLPSLANYVDQHERRERQIKETLERERALEVEVQGLKSMIKSERQKVFSLTMHVQF